MDNPFSERRSAGQNRHFPLRRRDADDRSLAEKDPYLKLSDTLAGLAQEKKFATVLISKELAYLTDRVRKYFPLPRIVYSTDEDELLGGKVLCLLNLACRRKHESYSTLSFREYAEKSPGPREPLQTLNFLSRNVEPETEVMFVSLGDFLNIEVARKYLMAQKFAQIGFIGTNIAIARKRQLLRVLFSRGRLLLKEVQKPEDIRQAEQFSKSIFPSEFNFDEKIDGLFSTHSDYFIVERQGTNSIVAVARHTWQLPNHLIPLMLATKLKSRYHVQLENPDKFNYGEVMVVYEKNHRGAIAYRELIKMLFKFLISSGLDVVFTTHLVTNKHEGDFYERSYGLLPTGVTLEYGDFGGQWVLVYGAKDGVEKNMKDKFGPPVLDT
jgi:hypothetical protein